MSATDPANILVGVLALMFISFFIYAAANSRAEERKRKESPEDEKNRHGT